MSPDETPTTSDDGRKRGLSMWLLAVPIVLTLAAAALAYFLLSPPREDLMTTTDNQAVAVAVANAAPALPAYAPPPSEELAQEPAGPLQPAPDELR